MHYKFFIVYEMNRALQLVANKLSQVGFLGTIAWNNREHKDASLHTTTRLIFVVVVVARHDAVPDFLD